MSTNKCMNSTQITLQTAVNIFVPMSLWASIDDFRRFAQLLIRLLNKLLLCYLGTCSRIKLHLGNIVIWSRQRQHLFKSRMNVLYGLCGLIMGISTHDK